MKSIFVISSALIASAAILSGSGAQATTFVPYGTALPTGETLISDFSTGANLTLLIHAYAENGLTDVA
jgi:hypothetical protein